MTASSNDLRRGSHLVEITCPTWCVYTPQEHVEFGDCDPRDVPLHKGAPLGRFDLWSLGDGAPIATLTEGIDLTASDLRALARDAEKAAEWIEARS